MSSQNYSPSMDDDVRLGLGLGLGLNDYKPKKRDSDSQNNKRKISLGLSIPLHACDHHVDSSSSLKIMGKDATKRGIGQSRFSNILDVDDDDGDESNNNNNNNKEECKFPEDFRCRKKLRLTRDQTTLLEDSFKQQTTLNTAVKQALAEKLNLKPRQVEVWFQNRRARTKLKQTEVDCEFLKKNCERLSEENWRLKKEVLELRSAMKMEKPPPTAPQFLYHNRAAAEKNRGGGDKKEAAGTEVVHISPN